MDQQCGYDVTLYHFIPSSLHHWHATSPPQDGKGRAIAIGPPFDAIRMDVDLPIGYQKVQRGIGGCKILLQLDAVLQDRNSGHRWHSTSPPQYGRVCSNTVGPHIDTKKDKDHPNGGKLEDQGVVWMHNAVVMFCRPNKSALPFIVDMPHHHHKMAECYQILLVSISTLLQWTWRIPLETSLRIRV